ncbi:hypothetical protein L6R21_27560, partial [bacterium]|nr:hypothetical protein [bacterium]
QQKNNKSKSPQFSQIWVTFNFEATGLTAFGKVAQFAGQITQQVDAICLGRGRLHILRGRHGNLSSNSQWLERIQAC